MVGERVLILNRDRRVVYANSPDVRLDAGPSLGAALGCIHGMSDAPCGGAPACSGCGVLAALDQPRVAAREVMLAKAQGAAARLRVRVSPIMIAGEPYFIAAFADTTAAWRWAQMEGLFFHDILNTAAALKGMADLSDWGQSIGRGDVLNEVGNGVQWLLDEISGFQMLAAAERNELEPEFQETWMPTFLHEIMRRAESLPRARGRRFAEDSCAEQAVVIDRRILGHVLLRIVERVLEETPPDGEVRLGAGCGEGVLRFLVRGAGVPLSEAEPDSLGAYSIQLFSGRYLAGRVFLAADRMGMVAEFPLAPPGRVEERSH